MAPQIPPIDSLKRPEKLSAVLKADRQDDCLTCRLTGAAALIGLGGYSYFSGKYQLQQQETVILQSGSIFGMKSRRMGIVGIAGSLVAMGVYRLVN